MIWLVSVRKSWKKNSRKSHRKLQQGFSSKANQQNWDSFQTRQWIKRTRKKWSIDLSVGISLLKWHKVRCKNKDSIKIKRQWSQALQWTSWIELLSKEWKTIDKEKDYHHVSWLYFSKIRGTCVDVREELFIILEWVNVWRWRRESTGG